MELDSSDLEVVDADPAQKPTIMVFRSGEGRRQVLSAEIGRSETTKYNCLIMDE